MGFYYLLMFFFIYGVLGWCVEVAYAAAKTGKFVNRGFLNGPICPIYGIGVVSVIYCLSEVKGNLIVLYLASVILVTVIEGITGFILDKLFHHKWWDYSGQPLNIGGYVCLLFSLIWGFFCIFIVKIFQPVLEGLVRHFPFPVGVVLLVVCSIAMIADLCVTADAILKLNKKLERMEKISAELRELSDKLGENIYEGVMDGMEKEEQLRTRVETAKETGREELSQKREELLQRSEELHSRYERIMGERTAIGERLLRAFPRMESRRHKEALQELRKRLLSRKNQYIKFK